MLNVSIYSNRVHIGERFSVSFQRTLRIPDDGKLYPLPPGLGSFPLHRVEDYVDRVSETWREHGGVFIPMYQREALWLGFGAASWKPNAVKIGVGKVNAVSGMEWDENLCENPQNYMVCPDQPWLDGINVGEGYIRQFVAMPLGQGYTIEAQLTDKEEFGGIQILVFEPKQARFPDQPPPKREAGFGKLSMPAAVTEMGLGAGGKMKQKIYPDQYGIDAWDVNNFGYLFVHIINSEQYKTLTALEPPPTPVSAKTYTEFGLPWFDLYDEEKRDILASKKLIGVKTIREKEMEKGISSREDDASVNVSKSQIKKLRHLKKRKK